MPQFPHWYHRDKSSASGVRPREGSSRSALLGAGLLRGKDSELAATPPRPLPPSASTGAQSVPQAGGA